MNINRKIITRKTIFINRLAAATGTLSPQIMKVKLDKNKLNNLISKYNQWRQEYAQILQRYDIKIQHSRNKQAMLNSEQVSFSFTLRYSFLNYLNK